MTSPLRQVILVAFAGLLLYVVLDLLAPAKLQYDEPIHLGGVQLIDQYGFTPAFLRHLPAGPGPLFTVIHYGLRPLTGLRLPWVRLVNPVLFLGIVILLNRLGSSPWLGINLMGSPFMALPIGLCLTEIPAMFFLVASLLLLFQALQKEKLTLPGSLVLGFVGGICLGIAMTGRQTYLTTLPAFLVLCRSRRDFFTLALYGLAALAFVCPLFVIWHGLVPPLDQDVETGFRPDHGFLAFAFLGLATLIIEPRFFVMPWRVPAAIAWVAALLDLPFRFAVISPLETLTQKHLSPGEIEIWSSACSFVFVFLATLTIVAYARHAWRFRHEARTLFALVAAGLILLGCMRMIQSISTRYVTTAMPFFLIGLEPIMRQDRWKRCRFAAAIALSAVILWSYLHKS